MIIPAGKRREQINQGIFKNEAFISDMFSNTLNKSAITGISDLQDQYLQDQQQIDPALQGAMNEGSGNGIAGLNQIEHQNRFKQEPDVSLQEHSRSPASRFLGRNTEDEELGDPNIVYHAEREKIRRFIGNDFGMDLKSNSDGTFTVTIDPPGPVQDPAGFMDGLLQYIGGRVEISSEKTPSITQGGPLALTYRPGGSPQKVEKAKQQRR